MNNNVIKLGMLAALLLPVISTAEDASVALPDMMVTATGDERLLLTTPYSTSVIDAPQIRIEEAHRTVPEALKHEPGIMIQKTAHGQGSPFIRGFTGQRNLFLIDGIRLNNSVFRDGPNQYWNMVDALSLSRLEVVRGPFSVLYGSDAMGGTVNAITRGQDDLRPDSTWDRGLFYRYGDAENSNIGRIESIGKLSDNMALSLGLTYKDFGDVEGGKDVGTQENTGYDEMDWDAKLEYFVGDSGKLTFAHQGVEQEEAWRTHKTIYGTDWEDLSIGKELKRSLDQQRRLTYLQYRQTDIDSFADELFISLSHQYQAEDRDRIRTEERHDQQGLDVHTAGAQLMLKSSSPIGRLTYGAELYHDTVNSYKDTMNPDGSVKSSAIQGPVGDDSTYATAGAYLQDEITATEKLSFILGGRYEYANAQSDSVQDPVSGDQIEVSGDWDALVGSARALYSLDEQKRWNLFGGISQGFRAPNLSDLTRLDSARTDEIETPSPDLDPEHTVSYELGIKAGTQNASAQLSCFYTDVNDMIVRTPTGRIIDGENEVTKLNGGDGYVQGIEFDGSYRFPADITAFGALTLMDGKVDTYPTSDSESVREYIDRLMPPTAYFGLRWSPLAQLWFEGACTIADDADKLSTRDESDTSRIPPGGTPGYTVYDLRLGWTYSPNLTLSLALENVTDEDYRIHGSGLNEPGRNLVLAVQGRF